MLTKCSCRRKKTRGKKNSDFPGSLFNRYVPKFEASLYGASAAADFICYRSAVGVNSKKRLA